MDTPRRGRLKVFFGYADGVGKTHAMLRDARQARERGTDVLVGCIAPHTAPETMTLLDPLPRLPDLNEFDLDAALARRPALVVVDELAHQNPAASRHRFRHQDVDELLKHGVDVYTTLNIGNIESLHDVVSGITGVTTWDRIPDAVFDKADQVELMDSEPQELIARLQEADTAESLLTIEQLTALRELALRRCADRVRFLAARQREKHPFPTVEHILVCLSSAPSNAKIIRTASRMAKAFGSRFTALYVETPDHAAITPENQQRLDENRRLAKQLGAETETVYGDDVPYQIAEFARLSGVTRIVLGRSVATRRHLFGKPLLTDQLLSYIPEIDIHIIPDKTAYAPYTPHRTRRWSWKGILRNTSWTLLIFLGATAVGLLFQDLGFSDTNIILAYLLGVLITSTVADYRACSIASALLSVVTFCFLFTTPRFSFAAYDTGYPVTFLIMYLTAHISGTLAARYKEQARHSARIAHRTKILFDTDQLLARLRSREEIITATAKQLQKLLERDIVVFERTGDGLSAPRMFYFADGPHDVADFSRETAAAQWVLKNNHAAGATTDTHADVRYLYLAIRVNERVYGVVGIDVQGAPLEASEHSILLSILGECALALENEQNAREKEAAAVLAESEQLRANLLRTISHDLRTPLTAISGNASNLLSNGPRFDEATKSLIYQDIYNDAMWLIELVENLLYATRIEEGRMQLRTSTELVSEIIEEAVRHVRRKAGDHPIAVTLEDDLLLVRADARLVVQVILNIVGNAIKYTPGGTAISIHASRAEGMCRVRIADTGPGIPDGEKERIFEKFYSGASRIADNRRSLGLGLYLCRAIVEAHGGRIHAQDNTPQGTAFVFTLPMEEITRYE